MSELSKRILVAVPTAMLFVWVTWLGSWYFKIMVMFIGLMVVNEMIRLFLVSDQRPDHYFPYSFALWAMLIPTLPHAFQIGLLLLILFVLLQLPRPSEENIRTLGSTLFSGLYAPLGLLSFIIIRSDPGGQSGFMLALILVLMVWGNDIFAYFGGKSLGKHPMAPSISPKKTWEGFGFGILGALVGFCLAYFLVPLDQPLTFLQALPAVLLVSIFGPAGDLSASKLKRAGNLKDTSDILPGHGGFLDRFDALILAAPVFYLYLYALRLLGYASF